MVVASFYGSDDAVDPPVRFGVGLGPTEGAPAGRAATGG